ncbi:MAG TPA: hypothetical protein PLC22_10850 [Gordonia sp. (in: high G+C Gram-positive bacteria)]|nr:hypothetical protein [Gordonia sp. (in: high G+C Gram-positive bacteria)]
MAEFLIGSLIGFALVALVVGALKFVEDRREWREAERERRAVDRDWGGPR